MPRPFFAAIGPLNVFLKLPVTEISEIDDRKSVSGLIVNMDSIKAQ